MSAKGSQTRASRTSDIIRRESSGKKLMEQSRVRLLCIMAFFSLSFLALASKLVEVSVIHHADSDEAQQIVPATQADEQAFEQMLAPPVLSRGDIVDRNGVVLATTLATESLFANPRDLADPADAARRLARIFPDLDRAELLKRFRRDASFVWVKRNLTPREQHAANELGIPGLYFQPEQKRIYPQGNLFSHLIGFVGLDQKGQAGIERYFDERLRDTKDIKEPLKLSVDVRLQSIVRENLRQGMETFSAIGATGIILDIRSGEILAMSNLPDFDPHQPGTAPDTARFDRASLGDYEMGSTFKTFTTAMALNYGVVNLNSSFDATRPLQFARFTIHDDHPLKRWLTVPEIYTYSSNIGTAREAMLIGAERQQAFLRKLGLMEPVPIELKELSPPHFPADWKEINTLTISYGHGMSVTPLHLVRAFASIVNGGLLEPLTLIRGGNDGKGEWPRVIDEKISETMRHLTRSVVEHGTAKKANVPGYRVGGKTGTAEKAEGGGYSRKANMSLFIANFPVDDPKYVILIMIDEPKGTKSTFGFTTGGWTAAPLVGNIVSRMGPMYGVRPLYEIPDDPVSQEWVNNANRKLFHAISY